MGVSVRTGIRSVKLHSPSWRLSNLAGTCRSHFYFLLLCFFFSVRTLCWNGMSSGQDVTEAWARIGHPQSELVTAKNRFLIGKLATV